MTGPDDIPLKVNKTVANIIDLHLENIIDKDLAEHEFSEDAKTVLFTIIDKKEDSDKIRNY